MRNLVGWIGLHDVRFCPVGGGSVSPGWGTTRSVLAALVIVEIGDDDGGPPACLRKGHMKGAQDPREESCSMCMQLKTRGNHRRVLGGWLENAPPAQAK
jgi:hypothetical protein